MPGEKCNLRTQNSARFILPTLETSIRVAHVSYFACSTSSISSAFQKTIFGCLILQRHHSCRCISSEFKPWSLVILYRCCRNSAAHHVCHITRHYPAEQGRNAESTRWKANFHEDIRNDTVCSSGISFRVKSCYSFLVSAGTKRDLRCSDAERQRGIS